MDNLKEILKSVLAGYTGKGLNGYSILTSNEDETFFTVTSIGKIPGQRIVNSSLVVRLIDDQIVIERDINDKILLDALLQAGVPREKIVLAYIGEPARESL